MCKLCDLFPNYSDDIKFKYLQLKFRCFINAHGSKYRNRI